MIHLDTSFLIGALIPGTRQDRALRKWIGRGEPLAVSSIAWVEFRCGPLDQAELALAEGFVGHFRDFTREDAELAARLYNQSGRRRGSLADCMIAAVALADRASVATANVKDCRPLRDFGLTLAG